MKKRSSYGGRPVVISRARYYDAKAGRFLQRDPILHPSTGNGKGCRGNNLAYQNGVPFEVQIKAPQNLNPYVYVINDPINLIDPYGFMGRRPSNDDKKKKKGYETGDICIEQLKLRKNTGACPNEDDCFICCGELIGGTEYLAIASCEAVCVAWLKSKK